MQRFAAGRWVGTAVVVALIAGACAGPAAPPTTVATTPAAPTATATPLVTPVPTIAPTPSTNPISISAEGILGSLPAEPPGTTWVRVSDPSAPFTFEVPSIWATTTAGAWVHRGTTIGVVLAAATDTTKLGNDFSAAGMAVGVSANPTGVTPREVVEEDDYSSACTATPIQEVSEPGIQAVYRSWEGCGPAGAGLLLQMGIVSTNGGLIGIVFQGSRQEDLGYLEHILTSLAPVEGGATPVPGEPTPPGQVTPTPGTGQLYTYDLDFCQNQHGQGIAEGNITNLDSIDHVYKLLVRFYDTNDRLLNDTYSNPTPNLHPGEQFHWQAVIPSGLPSTEIVCKVEGVAVVI